MEQYNEDKCIGKRTDLVKENIDQVPLKTDDALRAVLVDLRQFLEQIVDIIDDANENVIVFRDVTLNAQQLQHQFQKVLHSFLFRCRDVIGCREEADDAVERLISKIRSIMEQIINKT